jgi:hypothetical protein
MGFPLGVRREAQLKNPIPQEEAMAERRTWRRFTAAFKVQAVKRLIEGSRGLAR